MLGTPTWLAGRIGIRLLRSRRLMRAPILLYRARLGFVFGSRMLMLEHIGRISGVSRQVVLEVIDRPEPGTYVVASGFGGRAQWYRNVQANPRVRVTVAGDVPRPATARVLSGEDATGALTAYTARHPRAWAALMGVLKTTLEGSIDDLPMVALRLARDER